MEYQISLFAYFGADEDGIITYPSQMKAISELYSEILFAQNQIGEGNIIL